MEFLFFLSDISKYKDVEMASFIITQILKKYIKKL